MKNIRLLLALTCALVMLIATIPVFAAPIKLVGDDSSSGAVANGTTLFFYKYTATTSGTASKIYVYSTATAETKVAIYSDNSSKPGNRLGSATISTTASTWSSGTITSCTITAGNVYWLAFVNSASGATAYRSTGATLNRYYKAVTYATWTYPDPWDSGYTPDNGLSICVYAAALITVPAGTTDAASQITTTTARLNGTITDSGGQLCDVQFAYDNTTRANWADYVNKTTLVSDTYNTGDHPYADISSLTKAKTYYFRIGITNDNTTVYGAERNFTTENGISPPTNVSAVPYSTSVSVSWTKGTGANMTGVRYKLGTYPTTTAEGTLATLTTGNSVSITGLTAGRTYYVSLWGYTGGDYSSSYSTVMATTVAYNPSTDTANNIETPTASTTWTQTPSSAKLTTVPFHEIVEDISTSYGTPLNMVWYVIWVVIGLAGGILLYNRIGQNGQSSYNLPMVLVLEGIWFGIGAVIGLTMMWIVVFLSVTSAGFIAFGHRH